MGEWEQGLEAARKQGIIDDSILDRLTKMSFERQAAESKFPMRIALIVLGAILLVSAGFSLFVRILGNDPSQVFVAAVIAIVALVFEIIARAVLRAKPLNFLAGIIGSFAGVPLGFAIAVLLPGNPEAGTGAVGAIVAAVWSLLWFRRTKSGVAIAAVVLELALFAMLIGEVSNFTIETTGVVLCVLGVVVAIASIIGRIKPSLPPLVAS